MTTSSQQQSYLNISDLSTLTTDTITLTGSNSNCYYGSGSTITFTNNTSTSWCIPAHQSSYCTTTLGGISSIDNIKIFMPQEFIDCFPEWSKVEKMCEEYPGLKIAFEKFKTVYKLVKDDYDTPKDKRPKP